MLGMASNKVLHASIMNETFPYGHYRMDVIWVNINDSSHNFDIWY